MSSYATTTKFDEDCELKISQIMIKQKGAIRERTKGSGRVKKHKDQNLCLLMPPLQNLTMTVN